MASAAAWVKNVHRDRRESPVGEDSSLICLERRKRSAKFTKAATPESKQLLIQSDVKINNANC